MEINRRHYFQSALRLCKLLTILRVSNSEEAFFYFFLVTFSCSSFLKWMKQRLSFHEGIVRPEGGKKMRVSNAICILSRTSINCLLSQDTYLENKLFGFIWGFWRGKEVWQGCFFRKKCWKMTSFRRFYCPNQLLWTVQKPEQNTDICKLQWVQWTCLKSWQYIAYVCVV